MSAQRVVRIITTHANDAGNKGEFLRNLAEGLTDLYYAGGKPATQGERDAKRDVIMRLINIGPEAKVLGLKGISQPFRITFLQLPHQIENQRKVQIDIDVPPRSDESDFLRFVAEIAERRDFANGGFIDLTDGIPSMADLGRDDLARRGKA